MKKGRIASRIASRIKNKPQSKNILFGISKWKYQTTT